MNLRRIVSLSRFLAPPTHALGTLLNTTPLASSRMSSPSLEVRATNPHNQRSSARRPGSVHLTRWPAGRPADNDEGRSPLVRSVSAAIAPGRSSTTAAWTT